MVHNAEENRMKKRNNDAMEPNEGKDECTGTTREKKK